MTLFIKRGRRIRPAAQAGRFYPAEPDRLQGDVQRFLSQAAAAGEGVPKAIIAPHAGYAYSGPIAGSAFRSLAAGRDSIRRVVLIGPSHYAHFEGVAATNADAFATPLGLVPIDREQVQTLQAASGVRSFEAAHAPEHCLEVELPFLQVVLGEFELVPLLVGEADADEVGAVLDAVWGGPETCVVVSSDLSHYLDYDEARRKDGETADAIVALNGDALDSHCACGHRAIAGLLRVARQRGLRGRVVDLRNSGDTAGPRDRVVGYGAFHFDNLN